MSFPQWYLALFCVATGASIPLFWLLEARRRRGERDARWWAHVVAELVTSAFLLAAGVTLLADHTSGAAATLSAVGLGMLLYAIVESPADALVRRDRRLLALFALTWLGAIPALVARFATA